jgi:hypothetical protein
MPNWMQIISLLNPMSYAVDALRILMITGNFKHLVTDLLTIFRFRDLNRGFNGLGVIISLVV